MTIRSRCAAALLAFVLATGTQVHAQTAAVVASATHVAAMIDALADGGGIDEQQLFREWQKLHEAESRLPEGQKLAAAGGGPSRGYVRCDVMLSNASVAARQHQASRAHALTREAVACFGGSTTIARGACGCPHPTAGARLPRRVLARRPIARVVGVTVAQAEQNCQNALQPILGSPVSTSSDKAVLFDGRMFVNGSSSYQCAVLAYLHTIAASSVGKQLLSNWKVRRPFSMTITAGAPGLFCRTTPVLDPVTRGEHPQQSHPDRVGLPGPGTSSTIFCFDPKAYPLPTTVSTHRTPGHVALFHEMVHALRNAYGWHDDNTLTGNPSFTSMEELETIAGDHRPHTPSAIAGLSENAYRTALRLPLRTCQHVDCF